MINCIIAPIKLLLSPKKKFYRAIKKITGFCPAHINFYELAVVHRSASIPGPDGETVNNERLEYLGDAILGAVIADFLYRKFPDENEGFLTQMRSKIVNGAKLAELSRRIGLAKLIISNTSNSRNVRNIYGDAFEALIGAIYLDKGYKATRRFVIKRLLSDYIDLRKLKNIDNNYKSKLIEWGQKYKREVEFDTQLESENSKIFVAKVIIEKQAYGSGIGRSKKEAEQRAAKATLMEVDNDD